MGEVNVTFTVKLASVLSRVNMISLCFPDELQENMEQIINNISFVLKDLKYEIEVIDREPYQFLDKVTLYTELNSIYKDLGICFLITSNSVLLEDALYNTEFVMRKMAEYDSVFRYCYNEDKKARRLK